jgi:4-aminobutyrate aminotransferase
MLLETIDSTVGVAIRTELPGPEAKKILELDRHYVSPSYTRSYPLVARRGQGVFVEDVDGNIFLDFAAGIAVVATGHCHPRVVAAVQEQAARLIHMSGSDFYYENQVLLAKKLSDIAPGGGDHRVFFSNSGTEAVEAAIKLARFHTGRAKFIAFNGAFHGRTLGALSLTASKPVQRRGFGPLLADVIHTAYPNPYRCPQNLTPQQHAVECARVIENHLFKTVAPRGEVAAIVVEPVQGEGGYIVPPHEFLRELRRIADESGALLIFDEVQAGMGRTGKMWASEHSGVVPDIIASAKGIASGMPLGATIARADLMNWPPGAHGSTFGGNPVSIAAALTTIAMLEESLIGNAAAVGRHILERMRPWPETYRAVGDVRGLGLMIGVEIIADRVRKTPAPQQRDRIVEACFRKGVLLLGCGESTIRFSPPLIVSREQADFALDVFERVLRDLASDG